MKRFTTTLAALAIIIALGACKHSTSSTALVYATSEKNGVMVHTISMHNDSTSVRIEYSGTVTLNEDETALQSISPNGYINYMVNGKKAVAQSDAKGAVTYILSKDGKSLNAQDAEGKQFLAATIRDLNSYGLNLAQRIDALYKKGGSDAVLTETDNVKTDDLKRTCIEYLFAKETLSASELNAIAGKVSSSIEDDFVKKDLFIKYSTQFLKNPETIPAYLDAIAQMQTSLPKAQALKAIIAQPLSPEIFALVLKTAATIRSDYEKAGVLKQLADTNGRTEEDWIALIGESAKIGATAEKTDVLVHIGQKAPQTENVKAAYMKAANTITATPEHDRVVKTFVH
jgi:hypothetical protein